jgi:hypothetical protein
MKKYLIILLFFPTIIYSQKIVGVWTKNLKAKTAIQFTADGHMNIIELNNPTNIINRNQDITYLLKKENGVKYIEVTVRNKTNDQPSSIKKLKYKFKKGNLYLPSESTTDGVTTTNEYKDKYIKVK